MPFHLKHFPTFHSLYYTLLGWYRARNRHAQSLVKLGLAVAFGALLYWLFLSAPLHFPTGAYVRINKGDSLHTIAKNLEGRGVVRSAFLLKAAARVLGDHTQITAGEYYFPTRQGLVGVAIRLVSGDFNTTPVKILVPEGVTNREVAAILAKELPDFDVRGFTAAVKDKEGYLFPDTYFFMPGESTEAILSVFTNALQTNLQKIKGEIEASKKPLHEIITMASILEKEAATLTDRKLISGVLWRRIDIGMPLQVDAVFPYYLGRNTFEVTIDDLKQNHPYNTYVNKGLPPGPIGNPSLDAIRAAASPTKSNYVYFLSDKDGNFHFATTYEQHLANKERYLD